MTKKIILVLDCGATNVRCIAVNEKGELIASHSTPNNTQPDPYYPGGLIWDVDEIWKKLSNCTQEVLKQIDKKNIAGITVTTFGVDGAPVTRDGSLLYPVISWACERTVRVMENIDKYISVEKLYSISGVHKFSFNTINKLVWFKENKPEILDKMDNYLFISSIFIQKLCGEFVTELSMAGTSMLTDSKTQTFSDEIFNSLGIRNKFPRTVSSGEIVGYTTDEANEDLGIPKGVPVTASGHDTQFAVFGAGAKENEIVLSSGTWEILMARTKMPATNTIAYNNGITNEFDAVPCLYNPGIQWLGSGILEWLINKMYKNEKENMKIKELYDLLEKEASEVESNNINLEIDFLNPKNPISNHNNYKREEIYREVLEVLARKTNESLCMLESNCNFTAEAMILVGGGSKNSLWNKLRARELNIPIKLIDKKETTVLGAALFAMAGTGIYKSPDEARNNIEYKTEII